MKTVNSTNERIDGIFFFLRRMSFSRDFFFTHLEVSFFSSEDVLNHTPSCPSRSASAVTAHALVLSLKKSRSHQTCNRVVDSYMN